MVSKFVLSLALALFFSSISMSLDESASVDTLLTTARTASGKRVIDNLKNWRDTSLASDSDVEETKRVVIFALRAAGIPLMKQIEPKDMQIGWDDYYGLKILAPNGRATEKAFYFNLRTDGKLGLRSIYGGREVIDAVTRFTETLAAQNRGRVILGMPAEMTADASDLFATIDKNVFPMEVTASEVTATFKDGGQDLKGKESFYISIQAKDGRREIDMTVWNNGMIMGPITAADFPIPTTPVLLRGVKPEERMHVDLEVLKELHKKKGRNLKDPRTSALYDALAVILSDRRFGIETASVKELGRNRSIKIEHKIVIDPEFGSISFGDVLLEGAGKSDKISVDAGHFDIGKDLNKVEAWLYGKGEVGNQKGLYEQVLKSKFGK